MRNRTIILLGAILFLSAVAAVFGAAAALGGGAEPARAADAAVLTVTGNGQTKTFTMAEIQALPAYTGWSGLKNSAESITAPTEVKGVKLTDLLASVGGFGTGQSVEVTASDNYGMKFTYDQAANGGVTMYNATSGAEEAAKAPVSLVLTYEDNHQPLAPAPGGDGPLRLAVAQQTNVNQVADGHLMVKWVSNVTIGGEVQEWSVKMTGLRVKGKRQTYTLDRASYDSCSTPGCHGASWVDRADSKTWTGVPLFLCIGKVDGGKGHGGYGAYNEALARKGYWIKLISASGTYSLISSRAIINNDRVILANKLMGSELTADYYPLRLVGPVKKVPLKKSIGQIAKIKLLPW
jgi:DMSO/TMAO reductase YedYZ molybdopterin-dependent catalytic subunit